MTEIDVAVCGGGPAGLCAALWLGRYRRRTVVFDDGTPRNQATDASHGYLGFDGRPPTELLTSARDELSSYPTVEVLAARVLAASRDGDRFRIDTSEGSFSARRVLLGTGVSDELPDLPGFSDVYGTHVFHCSCCDGYESSGMDVLAIGWARHVAGFALDLLDWGARVTVVTNGESFDGEENERSALERAGIELIEERIERIVVEEGEMTGVVLAGGRSVPAQRGFFSIGHRPRADIATALGCDLDELGYVSVGAHGETSVEGVYAAGDITPGEQLVQVAASEGAIAGIACAMSLRGMTTAPGAPEPGPDPERLLDQ